MSFKEPLLEKAEEKVGTRPAKLIVSVTDETDINITAFYTEGESDQPSQRQKIMTEEFAVANADIVTQISAQFQGLDTLFETSSEWEFDEKESVIEYYEDSGWKARRKVEIELQKEEWLNKFAETITDIDTNIPTTESLSEMTVRVSLDSDFRPYDYTIYFETEEPHKFWADCNSLADYCEMVAENNEEITVEEMEQKENYYSHTHLMNTTEKADELMDTLMQPFENFRNDFIESLTVTPYEVTTDFGQTCTIHTAVSIDL